MLKNKEENTTKIIFSEEIDSFISGISLGLAFIIIAVFIYFNGAFHNVLVDRIVILILTVVGLMGTGLEINKINNQNKIYGLDNFFIGTLFLGACIFLIIRFNNLFINIGCVLVLLLSTFGTCQGLLQILYSLKLKRRKSNNKKLEVLKLIILITEVLAFAVALLQLINEIN